TLPTEARSDNFATTPLCDSGTSQAVGAVRAAPLFLIVRVAEGFRECQWDSAKHFYQLLALSKSRSAALRDLPLSMHRKPTAQDTPLCRIVQPICHLYQS